MRLAPGGIRPGAAGHDICFIHPRANDAFPVAGEGVLIELVQAPAEVIAAARAAARRPGKCDIPLRSRCTLTIRAILKMGDPRLLRIAPPVERFGTPELHALVADMFETMHAANGAGLAAPQIGVDLQLVIFGFKHNERYPDAPPVPETVLLNPRIEPLGDAEEEGWEGCLSVPGLRGVVPRFARIRYSGFDLEGGAHRARGRGLPRPRRPARVRPPDRHAVSDADARLQPLRLHQRAVSRARPGSRRLMPTPCKGTCPTG